MKDKVKKKLLNLKNIEADHYLIQSFFIFLVFLIATIITWNNLNSLNKFIFLFFKLGTVGFLFLLYFTSKFFLNLTYYIKKRYYDRNNIVRYVFLILIFILVLLIYFNQEEILNSGENESQIINFSKLNPILINSSRIELDDFPSLSFFKLDISDECEMKALSLVPDKIYFNQELDLNSQNIEDIVLYGSYDESDINEYYSLKWGDGKVADIPWGFDLKKGEKTGQNYNYYYANRDLSYSGKELDLRGNILGENKFSVKIITRFNGNVKSPSFLSYDRVAEFKIINKTITSCSFYSDEN